MNMVAYANQLLAGPQPVKVEDYCDICGEYGEIKILIRELGNIHACESCAESIEKRGDPRREQVTEFYDGCAVKMARASRR